MKKTFILLITVFLLAFMVILLISMPFITGMHSYSSNLNQNEAIWAESTWTKAVCNEENYCLDVLVTCKQGKVVNVKPIGKGVQFSKEWRDPRTEEFKAEWC